MAVFYEILEAVTTILSSIFIILALSRIILILNGKQLTSKLTNIELITSIALCTTFIIRSLIEIEMHMANGKTAMLALAWFCLGVNLWQQIKNSGN